MNDGFISTPQKSCHILSDEEYESLRLKKGDVLIIRTNGNPNLVGKAAVVLDDTQFAFASYLFRVITNKNISPELLMTFLNCKYGRMEIDRNSIKGNQTNFSPAKFRDIIIPRFGEKFRRSINDIVLKAYNDRCSAKRSYLEAEMTISNNLKIQKIIQLSPVISTKMLSDSFLSTGRLDAEYYQPKYDRLFSTLSKYTCKPLGGENGLVLFKKSIEPGSEYYQSDGVPFIRVSDISKFEIEDPEIHLPLDIVDNIEDLYPEKDTILFSKDGSVGIAYKVEDRMEIITSGALLHLTIKYQDEILPDYLTLVLNSPIVQLQAERDTNGAIIQHWKPSEIEKVVIPVLDMYKQIEISDKVKESFALRKKSKQLLEDAKRAVEIAIEQDEESAIEWLKDRKKEAGV